MLLRFVIHAAVQPVDDVAEAFALVGAYDDQPILRPDIHVMRRMVNEQGDDVFANLHQAAFKNIPIH